MGETPLSLKLLGLGLSNGPVCGRIAEVSAEGIALVEFPGVDAPTLARSIVPGSALPCKDQWVDAEVLLVFEANDLRRPIIIGFLSDRLRPAEPTTPASTESPAERVLIEAGKEIELRCGSASIRMTDDGRVVVKGRNLTSRASESNKVRGAVVLIN